MITGQMTGTFKGDLSVIGTTDANAYFPFYTLVDEDENRFESQILEHIIGDVYMYYKPEQVSRSWVASGYPEFFRALNTHVEGKLYAFKIGDDTHEVGVGRGYITDTNNKFLLLLTSNSQMRWREMKDTGFKNLRLYLSTEFILNPIYKNLYKKITTEYINEFYEKGIEVLFVHSDEIEKQCFANEFRIEFNNLQELDEHLNSGLGVALIETRVEYATEDDSLPF